MIKFILKHCTHMYDTYKNAADDFVEPDVAFKFGKWINDPCLPVWRNGPKIYFVKNKDIAYYQTKQKSYKVYRVINSVQIKTGVKESTLNGKPYTYDVYTTLRHKLPNGLRGNELVWNRNIRKKLRKFGLGWLKPSYELPRFFSFHIFNRDVIWKTKYYDLVYEFPPQFTIVFFGLSMSWWLKAPKASTDKCGPDDMDYWESILYYLYEFNRNIDTALCHMGISTWNNNDNTKTFVKLNCRPEYLKNPNLFYAAKSEYGSKHIEYKPTINEKFDFIQRN